MKGLFIVTRYLPFIFLVADLYMYFIPDENPGVCDAVESYENDKLTALFPQKCRVLENIQAGLAIVLFTFSETIVLWNNNRILRAATVCASIVSSQSTHYTQANGRCISQTVLVASLCTVFTTDIPSAYETSAIQGISGCYQSASRYQLSIPYLLLSVFALGLMILTLIRALQDWRINSGRLYVTLVKHNISYYACAFLLSATNVITSLFLQYSYQIILYDLQFVMLPILATRMHLHLWQVDQHARNSGTITSIPLSDMSFVDFTNDV
ncbi:uncharacterized protein EDB93DRAFT_1255767 [Suillus bovinus]|uniref:uncharacterized protein n=1 Tax=Suillus bovinus TaxID=48563 RepID=UPI001B887337|nr:uncharacterized protein EDB93DRAFT_1255767 [Suillus bovinus]KAG2130793.1 hypothetical protein EDB93DRAFT_1255767 [Suillus bovinus]